MKKDFIKKYIIKLILIIILIYCETSIDLKLPEYVSNVINIGVSQKGIEDNIPKYIRKSTMDLILKVTQNDSEILNYYNIVNNSEFKELGINSKEPVYILKNTDENLENLINEPMKNLVALQNKGLTLKIKLTLKDELNKEQLKYFSNLYEDGSNLIQILEELPEELQIKLISIVNKRAKTIDDTMFNQSINQLIIEEYKNLGIDVDEIQKQYNLEMCKQILICAVLTFVLEIFVIKIAINIATNFSKDCRNKVFNKFINLSECKINKFGIANFIEATVNNTNNIEMTLPIIIQNILYAPMLIIKGLNIIFNKSNSTMIILVVFTLIFAVIDIIVLLLITLPKFKDNKKIEEIIKYKLRNFINGAYIVRAFNQEKNEEKEFEKLNEKSKTQNIFINKFLASIVPTLLVIMEVCIIYIIFIGTKQIDSGIIRVGEIVEFMQITIQVIISFLSLSILVIILPSFLNSINQIKRISNLKEEKYLGAKSIKKLNDKKIVFENVSLIKDNTKILDNINFSILPGKINAIIGETGSGKSTIINLILQNIKQTTGKIKINNENLSNYKIDDLKELISVSFQENYIFSGTLENNFKLYNKNISKEKMYKICEIADLNEFIENKNIEKLDFKIIDGGKNISGGQRQRISIANALSKDFDILILDDSFSSMDIRTENIVKKAIEENYKDKTIILISQKISTIKNSDNIIVMKSGKIVAEGKHDVLAKNCNEYIDFINIQKVKEEF